MHFELLLSRPASTTTIVPYHTVDGTALAGQDYRTTGGSVSFLPGQTVAPVDVPIIGDYNLEPTESFTLLLGASTSWAATAATSATGTIVNDDTRTVSSPDPLFDPSYYLAHNPDVLAAGVDPYQHFITNGWKEGRDPSGLFSVSYYLQHNPDVAAAGINPLLHYELYGWKEGRDPSAQFSTDKYLAAYSDVRAANVDPLVHYLTYGQSEGRQAFTV